MACGSKEAGGVYRPRHPHESPFYRLVERFFAQFEAVYEERHVPAAAQAGHRALPQALGTGGLRPALDKTEHNAVGRFPEPGGGELLAGPCRNFQVFDPLDFLAEVTQHIPDPSEHLIRYYGWYSNKSRGQRAQRQPPPTAGTAAPARPPTAREARKGWAALIKQVCEADPLCCPRCGSAMKIIAFIERHQTEVIEKILRHCGLWEESPARGPPVADLVVEG